ncbi:MAG: transglycosylase domain-containing protein, partial [Deltaproteobacteria bacterium]|nr:transglycosylase domain-containing protein [Deltaproteobacteria bacterium]
MVAAPCGYAGYIYYQLPRILSFDEYAENCPKTSRVYAGDGSVAGEFFIERRTVLFPDEIPETFKKAIVAAEDADFYKHGGLSVTGILRAVLKNLIEGEIRQGGSTISQQLVKNFYLSGEKTLKRKFHEALMAWKMEKKLSKDEILAMYLNQIYLGHGRYGIEEASLLYFKRSAKDLKLHEAALIVGLIPAPEIYSPFKSFKLAKERQKYVLSRMIECGMIKQDEAVKSAAMPLLPTQLTYEGTARYGEYYLEEIRRQVIRHLGWTYLYYGGLKVFTPMDLRTQEAADSALFLGLHLVDGKSGVYSRDPEEKPLSADMIPGIFSEGLKGFMRISGLIFTGRVVGIDRENSRITVDIGGGIKGIVPFASFSRYSATGSDPALAVKMDQIARVSLSGNFLPETPVPVLNLEMAPQGAIVVIENDTRRCLAISGGDDFEFRKFNRATMAFREIGSVIKPFIFAAGIESGKISPGESFENAPVFLRGKSGIWSPGNTP